MRGKPRAPGESEMTREEFKKIKKSMKDEKFHELLGDYMKEISDPANMDEYDLYLQQLQNEGELPEVLSPDEGHAVAAADRTLRHQEQSGIDDRQEVHPSHLHQCLLASCSRCSCHAFDGGRKPLDGAVPRGQDQIRSRR